MADATVDQHNDELAGSQSDVAYRRLAHLIETCQLPPGWHLANESEEARRLGMSRTPFREALQRLEHEGLVGRVAKHRTFVTKIDPRRFESYMTIRRALEIELLHDALEQGADLDLAGLQALLAAQEQAARAGDAEAFLRLDPELHIAMVRPAANEAAMGVLGTAWRHINRTRYLGLPHQEADYVQTTLAEHRAILDALARADVPAVTEAIRLHTGAAMRRRLAQMASSFPHAFLTDGH